MTRWIVGLVAIFAVAALTPSLADASKPEHPRRPSGKHKHHHKKRGHRTVKSRGGPLSLQLGTVAISAPKGAIRKGQTLTIEKGTPKKFPALGTGSIVGGPFTISTSQGEPAKPVKVTFHYNPASLAQGGSPVVLHGWSAFGNWVPEESAVSSAAKTVSAKLDSFSPLDVVEDITWAAGLITGNRTDLPSGCGAPPSWVDGLSFPDAPNDSLPSCVGAGSNASTLYINVVNNRGYAQFVTVTGASIDVSHSSPGDSLEGTIANGLAKLSTGNTPSSFLLAPGSRAKLAIDRPPTSFGETTVTLHSAPQSATAAAAMGWALLNKLKAELGSGVDATNCVIGYLHNTLSANPSVSSVVGQLHSCASAAAAGLKGSAKTAAEKIASAVLVTDFFYKAIDLAADELYPPQISFSIPGKNPTNPDIHLGNLDFGTLPAGQQTVEHLSASGGTSPYTFAIWDEPANVAAVPSWINLSADGTLRINPPPGTEQAVSFAVYATDATGEHSPFARDRVKLSVLPSGGDTAWSVGSPGEGVVPISDIYDVACSTGNACMAVVCYTACNIMESDTPAVAGSWEWFGGVGSAGDITCPSTAYCVQVGEGLNADDGWVELITFDGNFLEPGSGNFESSGILSRPSCPTATTCLAIGGSVNSEIYSTTDLLNGPSSWHSSSLSHGVRAVSCVSETACVATGQGEIFSSTDPTSETATWTATTVDSPNFIESVSCASGPLCVAVDDVGNILTSRNPTAASPTWSVTASGKSLLYGVSCVPSGNLCVIPAEPGHVVLTADPTEGGVPSWSASVVGDGSFGWGQFSGVDCPSAIFCAAWSGDRIAVMDKSP